MKAATVIAVGLAAFSSFPSPATQDKQNPPATASMQQIAPSETLAVLQEPSATPTQPQTAAPSQAQAAQQQPEQQPNVKTIQLQLITGELVDKLDSKSAKQGDSVILKTREEAKTADGTDIPKGSKLVGHVTNVQARSDEKQNSQITLQFDRAELKNGQTLAIASVIESIAPSGGASTEDPIASASSPAPGAPGPAAGAGSSATSLSNNKGANNKGADPGATNTQAGAGGGPVAQASAQNSGGPAAGSIVGRSGNVAIRATSIPGVLLANNIDGQPFSNASGVLLGARRDISLDGGTQMVVGIATTPISGLIR